MPEHNHKYLVLARDRRCFENWCANKGLNPHSREVVYVTSTHHLRGYDPKQATIIAVCDWTIHLTAVGRLEIMNMIDYYKSLGMTVATDVCD